MRQISYNEKIYSTRGLWYKERIKQLADICSNDLKEKIVLDIGSSDAYLKDFCKSKKYYALDRNTLALKSARKRGCITIKQDLNKEPKLKFNDNFFDVVICTETLEHLIYPANLMKEIIRVCKRNGIIYISLPNELFWLYRIAILFGKSIDFEGLFHCHGHLHFPSINQSYHFIKKFNLKIEKLDYWYNYKISKCPFKVWNIFPNKIRKSLACTFPTLFARGIIFKIVNRK